MIRLKNYSPFGSITAPKKNQDSVLEKTDQALFHQLGGYVLLEEAVDLFYEKILSDGRINYFFGSNDTRLQRAQMKSFLSKTFGVEALYGNFEIDSDTSPLCPHGMTTDHFVMTVNHLRQSFLDLGVNASLVDESMIQIITSSKETSNLNPSHHGTRK